MDSRPRFHGGRLSAGGMGPRIREDNEGKGNKIPRLRCAALGMTCGLGRMSAGMDSRPRFHGGRLSAGATEVGARGHVGGGGRGWVPACARTREGEAFTPILAFPPQGGREG